MLMGFITVGQDGKSRFLIQEARFRYEQSKYRLFDERSTKSARIQLTRSASQH
jgi:hypothetical protein